MASEMIGETLKLVIVVTLVAVFSISVYSFLPEERIPYAEIQWIENTTNSSTVDLVHMGGDHLEANEITVIVQNDTKTYTHHLTEIWTFGEKEPIPTNMTNITEVSVIHRRAILFRGERLDDY